MEPDNINKFCSGLYKQNIAPVKLGDKKVISISLQEPIKGTDMKKGIEFVPNSFKITTNRAKTAYVITFQVKNNENKPIAAIFGIDALLTKDGITHKAFCVHPKVSESDPKIKCYLPIYIVPTELQISNGGINTVVGAIVSINDFKKIPDGEYKIDVAAWKYLTDEQYEECEKQSWSNNGELCDCIGVRVDRDSERDKYLTTEKYCGTKLGDYKYFVAENVYTLTIGKPSEKPKPITIPANKIKELFGSVDAFKALLRTGCEVKEVGDNLQIECKETVIKTEEKPSEKSKAETCEARGYQEGEYKYATVNGKHVIYKCENGKVTTVETCETNQYAKYDETNKKFVCEKKGTCDSTTIDKKDGCYNPSTDKKCDTCVQGDEKPYCSGCSGFHQRRNYYCTTEGTEAVSTTDNSAICVKSSSSAGGT